MNLFCCRGHTKTQLGILWLYVYHSAILWFCLSYCISSYSVTFNTIRVLFHLISPTFCTTSVLLYQYLTCFSVDWKMKSEVNFLGRLSHPNLVNLLGYCWDEDKLLLVYEFMPKGSLDYHLFRGMDSRQ